MNLDRLQLRDQSHKLYVTGHGPSRSRVKWLLDNSKEFFFFNSFFPPYCTMGVPETKSTPILTKPSPCHLPWTDATKGKGQAKRSTGKAAKADLASPSRELAVPPRIFQHHAKRHTNHLLHAHSCMANVVLYIGTLLDPQRTLEVADSFHRYTKWFHLVSLRASPLILHLHFLIRTCSMQHEILLMST